MAVLIGRLCLIITRLLDNAIIGSITRVSVAIIHETANTKAALQAVLVQYETLNQ